MKKFLFLKSFFLIISLFYFSNSFSQLTVTQGAAMGLTPLQFIQQVLVGSGVTVSNATYNGSTAIISSDATGKFTATGGALTQLGLSEGIIMTSGTASNAIGPNNTGSIAGYSGTGSDPDLELIKQDVEDKAVLEFDFIPLSDTIKFRYVFGSDEFDEYCHQNVSDVFGFFISGPGISGPYSNNSKNIALLSGTNTPVSIDEICDGGPAYSWANPLYSGQYLQYERLTHVFTAICVVIPCQQYHIKIAIGDVGDDYIDSGVFLEANSFTSNGLTYNTSYSSNIDTVAVEGCNNAIVRFQLSQPATVPVVIHYSISGTAVEGVDYPAVPDSLVISVGSDTASFTIAPYTDGISEPSESVKVAFINSACGSTDTIRLTIKDYTPISVSCSGDVYNCNGTPADIEVVASGGYPPLNYIWDDPLASTVTHLVVNPTSPRYYTVTVADECGFVFTDSVKVAISNLQTSLSNIDSISCYSYLDGGVTVNANSGLSPYSYLWSNSQTTSTVTGLAAGSYTVTITDSIGCTSTQTVVLNSPPQISVSLTPIDETCQNACNGQIQTNLSGVNTPPYSYLWSTNPPQSSQNASNLCPGNYTLTVTYSTGNCKIIETTSILTDTYISADFTSDVVSGYMPLTVNFTYTGTGAHNFLWDFGDGTTSTAQNPSHVFSPRGIFSVKLTVNSGLPNNCEDSRSVNIEVIQPSMINTFNAFSPNGDGVNDAFTITSEAVKSMKIIIYNRWGEPVYKFETQSGFSEMKEDKQVWFGEDNSGKKCAEGTYYYIIEATGYDGKNYKINGNVTLIR